MIGKFQEKIIGFINSRKDVPLLAGLSIGQYMLMFYYSRNFALANSAEQLLFFTCYYIVLPSLTLFLLFRLLRQVKPGLATNVVFTGFIGFLAFYLLQLFYPGNFWLLFTITVIAAAILSIWIKRYYKLALLLLVFMSVFNFKPLAASIYRFVSASEEWKKIPDDIAGATFKKKPNIYYIQPDGYASFANLSGLYNTDNSEYESFLQSNGFSLYKNYRSNYSTTLLSNSATFSMRHHYADPAVAAYSARSIIISENPVLDIFKNNGYICSFITEKPYLLMNRPTMGYDRCNTPYSNIPYLKDGLGMNRDIQADLESFMENGKDSGNFYFIEKFSPGHIHARPQTSLGREAEQELYLSDLKKANVWLKEMVGHILLKDPSAIIIIGADHGGYLGFEYTGQSSVKTQDEHLIKGIFGAQLAIRWNHHTFENYDDDLKSGINLFRTLFAFLAEEGKYLKYMEDDSSYISLTEPLGTYKYLDDDGKVVFEKH